VGRWAEPREILPEPLLRHPAGPVRDFGIGCDAQPRQLIEVCNQSRAVLLDHLGLRPAVEARHPRLVAPEQMAERAMQRAPERAAVLPPVVVGNAPSRRIEPPTTGGRTAARSGAR